MRQHAVLTAVSLYERGTLTLEQAASYIGLSPGKTRAVLRMRGVDVREHADDPVQSVLAD